MLSLPTTRDRMFDSVFGLWRVVPQRIWNYPSHTMKEPISYIKACKIVLLLVNNELSSYLSCFLLMIPIVTIIFYSFSL